MADEFYASGAGPMPREAPPDVTRITDPEGAADRFEAEAMPHMKDLYRMAIRMLGEPAQAEDVLQESIYKAGNLSTVSRAEQIAAHGCSVYSSIASITTGASGSAFRY
jgi:hypothetical protein